jgi:hypothetical protein
MANALFYLKTNLYFQVPKHLKYLENNVLQLYKSHKYYFWDYFYSFFYNFFFQAIFEKLDRSYAFKWLIFLDLDYIIM